MTDRFYMCFVEGGNSPTHQHTTPESAETEAERLARVTGRKVHVLASVASCQKTDVQWEKHTPVNDDDIPF